MWRPCFTSNVRTAVEFIQTANEQSKQTRNYGTTHIPVGNQEVGGLSPRRPADRQLRLDLVFPVRQTLQGPNTAHRRPLRQSRPRITNREKCVSDSSGELMLFALFGPSPSPSPKLRYGRDVTAPTHLFWAAGDSSSGSTWAGSLTIFIYRTVSRRVRCYHPVRQRNNHNVLISIFKYVCHSLKQSSLNLFTQLWPYFTL